jgi:hypothetical protein
MVGPIFLNVIEDSPAAIRGRGVMGGAKFPILDLGDTDAPDWICGGCRFAPLIRGISGKDGAIEFRGVVLKCANCFALNEPPTA